MVTIDSRFAISQNIDNISPTKQEKPKAMTKQEKPLKQDRVDANIPTNDAYRDLTLLLNIHKDRELLTSLFASQGIEVSNSKLQSWSIRRDTFNRKYRPMPTTAFQAFIIALHERHAK